MNLPPPPQDDDTTLAQFRPVHGQWELNDDNVKRIDPRTGETIFNNYCRYINTTPLAVYRYLIETKGCDVNAQDKYNDTPLHRALCCFDPNSGGDIAALTYLLNQEGINGNIENCFGYTLLHTACEKINTLPIEMFKVLIEKIGCDVNAQEKHKDTPIHFAIEDFKPRNDGDIAILNYLLNQKGVNVNIKGKYGYTLLHIACRTINKLPLEIFKVLIETLGFNVNAQNDNKNTPLHCALCCFRPNNGGDIAILNYLLNQKGINANIKDKYGYTLLHHGCQNINHLLLDVFKLLIENIGCDVNAQNNNNGTPIHFALGQFDQNRGGDIAVLTYLLNQKGVNVNIKGEYGYTLLHTACERMNKLPLDIFKLLVETMGCDVHGQDNDKNTPIYYALRYFEQNKSSDFATFAYFINQKNFNLNITGWNGFNLLHLACSNNRPNSRGSVKLTAECDDTLCQIVEVIVETCIEQVVDARFQTTQRTKYHFLSFSPYYDSF